MANSQDKNKRWYSITANAKSTHADIELYGYVGGWKVNIQRFLEELKQYKNLQTIKVKISTLGGTFMDGLPIYNELKQHKAHVTTVNMGYAVSMGSVIMLAGDRIEMAQNAMQMLHSPNTYAWDTLTAKSARKLADVLDTHQAALIPRYRQRLGLSTDEVNEILDEETWYTADQALEAGLIDGIIDKIDLDDVEEKMTEAHWRETVGMMNTQPPAQFMSRLEKYIPEANQLFNKPDDLEEEEMTPEQIDQFKADMKEIITDAVGDKMDEVNEGLDKRIEDAFKPVTASLKKSGEYDEKSVTALQEMSEKLDKTTEYLKKVSDNQEQQGKDIAASKKTLDEVRKLPVNQRRIDDTSDGETINDDDTPYS